MYIYIYIYINIYTYTYKQTYIYIYICIYTYLRRFRCSGISPGCASLPKFQFPGHALHEKAIAGMDIRDEPVLVRAMAIRDRTVIIDIIIIIIIIRRDGYPGFAGLSSGAAGRLSVTRSARACGHHISGSCCIPLCIA